MRIGTILLSDLLLLLLLLAPYVPVPCNSLNLFVGPLVGRRYKHSS